MPFRQSLPFDYGKQERVNRLLLDKIESSLAFLSKAAILALMLLMTADAVLRYLFNAPIVGATVISTDVFMVLIVYFSLSYVFAADGHIRITFIRDKFNKRINSILEFLFSVLAFMFWGMIVVRYYGHTIEDVSKGFHSTIGFEIPTVIPNAIIFIGAFVLLLRLVFTMYQELRKI